LKDDEEGNLILTLLSKTDDGVSLIFNFGDCAGQGRCLKFIFMLLKPRLDTSDCVYGRIVILKNSIIDREQHLDHRMHLAT
jgi:hypothetical protein